MAAANVNASNVAVFFMYPLFSVDGQFFTLRAAKSKSMDILPF
jgi:hypothetical protein